MNKEVNYAQTGNVNKKKICVLATCSHQYALLELERTEVKGKSFEVINSKNTDREASIQFLYCSYVGIERCYVQCSIIMYILIEIGFT